MSLHEDLARRDFTINAFAFDPRSGEVIDPFDGIADLERRLLRATTPASFTGDPLRVLRLPRLLLRLPGFAADPGTLLLARRSAPGLANVAAERVRDELAMLFAHPEVHRGLALLMALDVYPGLWLARPGEPGQPAGALAELEALPERVRELRQLDTGAADGVDAPAARLAATFVHLPRNGHGALQRLERFRDAGYLTRQEAGESRPRPRLGGAAGQRPRPAALPPPRRPALGHGRRLAGRARHRHRRPRALAGDAAAAGGSRPQRGQGAVRSAPPADRRRGPGAARGPPGPRGGAGPRRGAAGSGGRQGPHAGGGGRPAQGWGGLDAASAAPVWSGAPGAWIVKPS